MRRTAVIVGLGVGLGLCAAGCGRLGFSDSPPPGDAPGGPLDAPPVPAAICSVDRIALSPLPAMADLAITGTAEGYAAIWVDAAAGGMTARGALLGPNRALIGTLDLPELEDPQIGGITDVGAKLVVSTGSGAGQTSWIFSRDLTMASSELTLAGAVVVHGAFPSDTAQTPRVFVSAMGMAVSAALIATDGTINTASTVNRGTSGPVTDLACADGPDHSHCAYVEALPTVNGASQCTATDVRYQPTPTIPGGPVLSADCYHVRTSSGPDLADSMIVVWSTADGRVESRYVGSGGLDLPRSIAPAGSAPKVQFDGTRFWIAWLDGGGGLQLASFDVDGHIVGYGLPGWVPIGPEAFELVRRGNQTGLVLLSTSGLEFLSICT